MGLTPAAVLARGLSVDTAGEQTSRTYRIDFETGRVRGMAQGLEAMTQAVRLILNTERFRHLIYSWRYGVELEGLLGQNATIIESELGRILREALLADSRVSAVTDIVISRTDKRRLLAELTVRTALGDVNTEVIVDV